jgi:hypothetical protein
LEVGFQYWQRLLLSAFGAHTRRLGFRTLCPAKLGLFTLLEYQWAVLQGSPGRDRNLPVTGA